MTKHFHNELEKIKKMILSLSAMVEERVDMAIKAIIEIDADLVDAPLYGYFGHFEGRLTNHSVRVDTLAPLKRLNPGLNGLIK